MVNTQVETSNRKNPVLGRSGAANIGKMVGSVVIGLTVVKAVPEFLPSQWTAASPWVAVLAAGATAWGASWVARKYLKDATVADSVLVGGLAGASLVGLGLFLPASVGQTLGLGEMVPSGFSVPQNSIRGHRRLQVVQPITGNCVWGRAYGDAS